LIFRKISNLTNPTGQDKVDINEASSGFLLPIAGEIEAQSVKNPIKMELCRAPDVSVCQVESNLPGEDRYCVRVTEDILTYAVYDGHGGYLAADIACGTLLDMIVASISAVPKEVLTNDRFVYYALLIVIVWILNLTHLLVRLQ
jgi:hypothetical protein